MTNISKKNLTNFNVEISIRYSHGFRGRKFSLPAVQLLQGFGNGRIRRECERPLSVSRKGRRKSSQRHIWRPMRNCIVLPPNREKEFFISFYRNKQSWHCTEQESIEVIKD
jgi:hypothetical protein